MKIVLYYTHEKSFISRLISFITRSDITHASIINRRVNYDTDMLKKEFQRERSLLTREPDRKCIVYDFGDEVDCDAWIQQAIGVPYDLLGYFLWIFGKNPSEMHCFDTITEVLKASGFAVPEDLLKRPTGTKLRYYLDSLDNIKTEMTCKEVLKYVT